MFNNSHEALLRRKLEQEDELQKAIDLHSRRLMGLQLMDMKNKENHNQFQCSSSPVIPVSCQNNSQSPNYQVTAGLFFKLSPFFINKGLKAHLLHTLVFM